MKILLSSTGANKKEFAQGIVEFALAIPILLLVAYGLLEAGRLLFIYASTVTAARQAVRYGSAVGINEDSVPRYQDCAGMRAAARNVGFINEFDDIDISFDHGINPDTGIAYAPNDWCPDDQPYLLTYRPLPIGGEKIDRVVVSVSTKYTPILPLVPLEPMTIKSSSARTILEDVYLKVEGDGVWFDAPTPTSTNTPTPTATNTPTDTPTPTATSLYTLTPSNTPTDTNTPTITFTPTNTFTPTATGTPTFTPSPTATPIECYVSHDGLSVTQNKMLLTVNNDSNYPITISSISIFYNALSPIGQGLTAIYSGGTLIWDDSLTGSPITVSEFLVNESIDPWSSTALKLFFEKSIKVDGTELMTIAFVENGCPLHDTSP